MRATIVTLACVVLSLALVGCQYVDAERASRPTPTPEGPDFSDTEWMQRGRLTILISGLDVAPDREGARTDAMIVASLDLESGQPTLFGIPRNFGDIPLPDDIAEVLGTNQYTGMLKWLYGDAQKYPELAPDGGDPGMVALKGAISELLGLEIDYYAMVDMAGFIELIDAFGGLEIDLQAPIVVRLLSPVNDDDWQQFEIPAGEQRLDGQQALAYSRHRTGTTDYDRMERQRCLVMAMTEQADLQTLLLALPDLLEVIREYVVTDIPVDMLPDLVTLRETIDTERIISVGFGPPEYHTGMSSDGHNLPNYEAILETVQYVLENPDEYLESVEAEEVSDLEVRHC